MDTILDEERCSTSGMQSYKTKPFSVRAYAVPARYHAVPPSP
jgi:hypothetical protein